MGPFEPSLAGSELEKLRGTLAVGAARARPGRARPRRLSSLRSAVRGGEIVTAHDVSEGGLACALAECCIAGGIGARIDLSPLGGDDLEATLFGEAPGGVVIAGPRAAVEAVPGAAVIGEVGGEALELSGALSVGVNDLEAAFEGAIPAAVA